MATGEISVTPVGTAAEKRRRATAARADRSTLVLAVEALASLKLTVALFAASILLILFGTLAQVHYDVWHVVRESHFHVLFAWVEWRSIGRMLEMLFGGEWDNLRGGFYFPGGQLIGGLMMANLLAAHSIRFKANAKGGRLLLGWAVIAVGVAAVVGVVLTSNDDTVKTDLPPMLAAGLWHTLRASVAGLAIASLYWSVTAYGKMRLPEWLIGTSLVAVLVAAAGWLFLNPSVRLDDAGLRILWQLVKGSATAALLLVGCLMVFGKRGGMVLLHGGIGLLMVGEMLTGMMAEEAQMRVAEGEAVNYAVDIRTTELAFTYQSEGVQRVAVVPQGLLKEAVNGEVIRHAELPVDLRVLRFDTNSVLVPAAGDDSPHGADQENPATAGAGVTVVAAPVASASGIEGADVNLPSAYVELLDKESGEPAGVYLASVAGGAGIGYLKEQAAPVGGQDFGLELRFKRLYKDYTVKLHDFQFNRYAGTNVAKDFRSEVRLVDPSRSVDRDVPIWMNNPLRYAGDTLYQSGFDDKTETTTVLQVVTNTGWLIPYLSCQIVLVGMLAHFGVSLSTFLRRRVEEARRHEKTAGIERNDEASGVANVDADGAGVDFSWRKPAIVIPVAVALIWGLYLASKARPVADAPGEMRLAEFGALPVTDGGRVKPYDTLARNTLQFLSSRQTVSLDKKSGAEEIAKKLGETKLAAIRWMLDVVTGSELSRDYPVFRVENLEVLDLLGLPRRPGSYRYSYNEVVAGDNNETLGKQLDLLRAVDPDNRSVFQTKMAQLGSKLNAYRGLANAFAPLPISGEADRVLDDLLRATQGAVMASGSRLPRAVAPNNAGGEWLTQYEAQLNELFRRFPALRDQMVQAFAAQAPMIRAPLVELFERFDNAGASPTSRSLGDALDAYAASDTESFNTGVRTLKKQLAAYQLELDDPDNADALAGLAAAERMSLAKSGFEAFFNHFSPFFYCWVSYILAFGLCAASWLGWEKNLGRAATAIIAVTFLVHTFALVGRIYISGRPPVTNLYSSAIFIGWAVVLAGLAFEAIFCMGIGSLIASVFGFLTLVTAHFMALDGDTFTVLQAVLDTQFWLATHVVCITFGYAATFVAGGIAIVYLIRSHLLGNLSAAMEKTLPRMIYGTLCFAIFFSFVGTVLGGLWGDNSWGRFWGWDPKENGALIIVLWNALVLHARWGKLVGSSGLAALAVFGNVCTTWSWFGVNEMGVGLHAYGGLSDGVSLELSILRAVAFSHPFAIAIALVPRDAWRSIMRRKPAAA